MSERGGRGKGVYRRILEHLFTARYSEGVTEIPFTSADIRTAADEIGVAQPANPPDVLYSMRYRGNTTEAISQTEPEGKSWVIRGKGRGSYSFDLMDTLEIVPNPLIGETKVPDATPGIVAMYASDDEQALLVGLRYNRLIDIFTGITCYSLQNHLRAQVERVGQVETDEIYVGVDRRGTHYVLPVQAKGGTDRQNVVQIEQDFALCAERFPTLICKAIGAQFMANDIIALFEFERSDGVVALVREKHYRLVPPDEVTEEDLRRYKQHPLNGD
ncbi:MAG: endonuclease [Actinobacteria bacterium]|nr:MAG: endonuclease [Actinomycetota bacterium]